MREFFHGRRRKIGVLTLVAALWLTGCWELNMLDFQFVDGNVGEEFGIQISYWIIPHWSIIIPLTMLSAWLLLSKPRRSTQEKITEPVPEATQSDN